MAGIKIVDLPALGRDLISTDLLEVSLNGSGSRKITGQEIMNASKLAVGSTPIVSGTVGRLLFQNTGDVLGQSANLFWDDAANRFIIGGSTASNVRSNTNEFNVQRDGLTVPTGGSQLMFNLVGSGQGMTITNQNGTTYRIGQFAASNVLTLGVAGNSTLNLFTSGNIGINTTTDAGYKLDVNGNARVKTDLKIETATGGLTIEGDAGGYPTLKINTLRSGTTRRNWMFATEQFNGGDFVLFRSATGGGAANTLVYSIFNNGNVGINTTTDDGFKLDVNGTARVSGLNGNMTFSAVGDPSLIINSNTGTLGQLQLKGGAATSWIIGTQDNFLSNALIFRKGATTTMVHTASGNLLINTTTDAGFRLDVNGTARVNNVFYVTNSAYTGNIRIESIGNYQQRIGGGPGAESIVFGAFGGSNVIQINAAETYFSANVYPPSMGLGGGRALFGVQDLPVPSAQIELRSTTRGFLPPRMTNAQRAAIASPAVGLIVYCTDSTEGLYVYKSTGWTFMV